MNLSFLKPKLLDVALSLIIFSLPILREIVRFPDGTVAEIDYYRPIYLLASYLQMQNWAPSLLLVGFFLVIYFFVSLLVFVMEVIWKKMNKQAGRKK